MKILMVCLGNICRSPLAEGLLRRKAADAGLNWQIDSAGTNRYHIGEAPHRLSTKIAALNGIDISQQRARTFTTADFEKYDHIYALAGDVMDDIKSIAKDKFDPAKITLLMDELHPGRQLDVPDPFYGEEPGYHDVFNLISEACDMIIERYNYSPRSFLTPNTYQH
jgi:protein-tyrosine phosphatase